jgi:hypothetical protein
VIDALKARRAPIESEKLLRLSAAGTTLYARSILMESTKLLRLSVARAAPNARSPLIESEKEFSESVADTPRVRKALGVSNQLFRESVEVKVIGVAPVTTSKSIVRLSDQKFPLSNIDAKYARSPTIESEKKLSESLDGET